VNLADTSRLTLLLQTLARSPRRAPALLDLARHLHRRPLWRASVGVPSPDVRKATGALAVAIKAAKGRLDVASAHLVEGQAGPARDAGRILAWALERRRQAASVRRGSGWPGCGRPTMGHEDERR
jgi:hypothetical protein